MRMLIIKTIAYILRVFRYLNEFIQSAKAYNINKRNTYGVLEKQDK
jgi:hypothetical protein